MVTKQAITFLNLRPLLKILLPASVSLCLIPKSILRMNLPSKLRDDIFYTFCAGSRRYMPTGQRYFMQREISIS